MKTKKQVLAMFRQMQDKFFIGRELRGFASVEGYDQGNGYWTVKLSITEFNDDTREIIMSDRVEWTFWGKDRQTEQDEADNMAAVEAFREKYNLK